eukprot:s3998_g5.t1
MDLHLVLLTIYGLSERSCTATFARADLAQAARRNREDMVRFLLQAGVDKDCRHDGMTALMIAAASGSFRVARMLLEAGAEKDIANHRGRTALMLASEKGDLKIASLLLEFGAAKDLASRSGRTALMLASARGHFEVARTLLEAGAKAGCADREGKTALMLASLCGHVKIAHLLLQFDAEKDGGHYTALMLASEKGDLEVARLLLEAGAEKDTATREGKTALMLVSLRGHLKIVRLLLEGGAEKDIANRSGRTSLMLATERGDFEVVRTLLEAGARTDKADRDGKTALMLASLSGHLKIAQLLLQFDAEVNVADRHGRTALMLASFASERSNFEVARLLLEAGAKKEYSDHDGRTALMLASLAGNCKIASLLLDAGAETHAADRYASTALMLASESGHFEVVRLLMNAGADACCSLLNSAAEGWHWQRSERLWDRLTVGLQAIGRRKGKIAWAARVKAHILCGRPRRCAELVRECMASGIQLHYKLAEDLVQASMVVYHSSLAAQEKTDLEQAIEILGETSKRQKKDWGTLHDVARCLVDAPSAFRLRGILLEQKAKNGTMASWPSLGPSLMKRGFALPPRDFPESESVSPSVSPSEPLPEMEISERYCCPDLRTRTMASGGGYRSQSGQSLSSLSEAPCIQREMSSKLCGVRRNSSSFALLKRLEAAGPEWRDVEGLSDPSIDHSASEQDVQDKSAISPSQYRWAAERDRFLSILELQAPAYPRILCVARRYLRKNKYVDITGEFHLDLIQDNGGAPIILPRTTKTIAQLCEYLPMDGLVIAEGNDLSDDILKKYGCSIPERLSGEAAKKFASDTEMDVSKDELEFALMRFALAAGVP